MDILEYLMAAIEERATKKPDCHVTFADLMEIVKKAASAQLSDELNDL